MRIASPPLPPPERQSGAAERPGLKDDEMAPLRVHQLRVALLLAMTPAIAKREIRAQATAPRFAGIEWGEPPSTVREKLGTNGFVVDSLDKDGDIDFHGTVSGNRAGGFVFFANEKAVKVSITIAVPDVDVKHEFDQMKDALTRKYGEPQLNLDHYDPPYESGDGYFVTAVKVGKAHIATAWTRAVPGGKEGLVLTITQQANVQLGYESAAWNAEVDRRRDRAIKAF